MSRSDAEPAPLPSRPAWAEDAKRLDVAVYAAVASTPTPALDLAMRRLSRAADYSRLSLASAAALGLAGGRPGRHAAAMGLSSLAGRDGDLRRGGGQAARAAIASDRAGREVPLARHVQMPDSRSFPSGHSAGAFAFATGVGRTMPRAAVPLRALAAFGRLLPGPHRRALPRGRPGGCPAGHGSGADHHARALPPSLREPGSPAPHVVRAWWPPYTTRP